MCSLMARANTRRPIGPDRPLGSTTASSPIASWRRRILMAAWLRLRFAWSIKTSFLRASRHRVAKSRGPAVAALYEQHRVRHVWSFPGLEDQMCSFTIAFDRRTAGFSLSPGPVDA